MCFRSSSLGRGGGVGRGSSLAQFWLSLHTVSLCPSSCWRTQAGPQGSQSHQTRALFWVPTPRKRNGNGIKLGYMGGVRLSFLICHVGGCPSLCQALEVPDMRGPDSELLGV